MTFRFAYTIAVFLTLLTGQAAVADSSPTNLELKVTVGLDSGGNPTKLSGHALYYVQTTGPLCFYLPYNDSEYGNNRGTQERMDRLTGKSSRVNFEDGGMKIQIVTSGQRLDLNAMVVRFTPSAGIKIIEFQFDASLPLPPDHPATEWIFDGYYPRILQSCPQETVSSDQLTYGAITDAKFDIAYPKDLQYAGPGIANPAIGMVNGEVLGQTVAFALARDMRTTKFEINEFPIEIHYRNQWFIDLVPTMERLIPIYIDLLGHPPTDKFVFIEASELQRNDLPGLIAINRPRQSAFNSLLHNWLNWHHWLLARTIASQWFGAAVTVGHPDDLWLLEGLVEFSSLEALRQIPEKFNLFQSDKDGDRLLSFDFLQIMEISAASLHRSAPFTVLTDTAFNSARPRRVQHPLAYIRNAIALSQISGQVSRTTMFALLRTLVREYWAKILTPLGFFEQIHRLPSPMSPSERDQAARQLSSWWTTDGWPDFALTKFDKQQQQSGKWITTIEARQEGGLDFPPVVRMRDYAGIETRVRMRQAGHTWATVIESANEPNDVDIDPDHESFDSDRFNNTNRWPTFKFFPGSANSLRDDGYTIIWAPYAFRAPGEPVSIAIKSAVFRYINGGFFANAAVAPGERLGQYAVRKRYQFTDDAIHGDLQVEQDYDGDRVAEVSFVRSPVFDSDPALSLSARIRHKNRMGLPDTAHQTVVAGVGLKPMGDPEIFTYNLGGEYESSPPGVHPDFAYERRYATLGLGLNLRSYGWSSRLFLGKVTTAGLVPEQALFEVNDLSEARMRLDVRDVERVYELGVVTNNFNFPLVLPLPNNALVLSRRVKGRIFYDAGRATIPWREYRSAGAGFVLPFGGDISGAGSVAFTRLTVLGIFYTNMDGEESRKPSIVFDFSGQL